MLFVLKSDEPLVRVFRINFMALECLFYSFIGNRQIAKVHLEAERGRLINLVRACILNQIYLQSSPDFLAIGH